VKYIPFYMRPHIIRWIEEGGYLGDFLTHLLSNDLFLAFHHADVANTDAMKCWVEYLYNFTPGGCWGSPEKVKAWRESGGLIGQGRMKKEEKS